MTAELKRSIEAFIQRYPQIEKVGKRASLEEIENVNPEIRDLLPEWLLQLLIHYPIAEIIISIPYDFGQPKLKELPFDERPLLKIKMNSLAVIEQEATEYFPGCELINDGFICIAKDEFSTGEGIYIDLRIEDPALLLVFHDLGENNRELIDNADKLLDKFSDLFVNGKIEF
ncbi:MAG: hypothetical protein ACK4TA_13090 [Saprospiraceae bacterium]